MSENAPTIHVADWLAEDWAELQQDPTFVSEGLRLDVAMQIAEVMEEADLDMQVLADQLDTSQRVIARLLNGDEDISLQLLARVALTLDKDVEITLVDRETPEVHAVSTEMGASSSSNQPTDGT